MKGIRILALLGVVATYCLAKLGYTNYIPLYCFYFVYHYLEMRERGVIGNFSMKQFILGCIGTGCACLLYTINKELNIFTRQIMWVGLILGIVYISFQFRIVLPKPNTEDLLDCYKSVQVTYDTPEECLVCLDLVTFMQKGRKCGKCKKIFHKKCLRGWCEESANCPHCRHLKLC